MGRHLSLPAAFVVVNDLIGVDGQSAVGVDSDTEKAGVGLWNDTYQLLNFFYTVDVPFIYSMAV